MQRDPARQQRDGARDPCPAPAPLRPFGQGVGVELGGLPRETTFLGLHAPDVVDVLHAQQASLAAQRDERPRARDALPDVVAQRRGALRNERVVQQRRDIGAELRAAQGRGTFSAAAVAGLASSGSAAERTARASEQTAKNTKRLVDAAQSGGLAFA